MTAAENDPMPVFTIQAKDKLAVLAVVNYRDLCDDHGLQQQAMEVQKAVEEMCAWRDRNRIQLKMPDHPHVPATAAADDRSHL